MYHPLLFAAFAAAFAAVSVPPAAVPPNAYLAPGTYGGVDLKGFTARDAQPLYTDALKQVCSNAASVDAALAKAPPSGNGVLLGSADGRIVVSESIHPFPNAKSARRFVTAAQSSPACVGYGARDSMNRVFAQYPQLPPVPTFVPQLAREGRNVYSTFEGTSADAPLAGSTALLNWHDSVAEASVRIANPRPGELDSLSKSLRESMLYIGSAAIGPGADPKRSKEADALAADFVARAAANTTFGLQPSARAGVPSNPPSCSAATDAYLFSGEHAVVRGFSGQDPSTYLAVKPELFVFPKSADADRYLKFFSSLAVCFADLYKSALPSGSTVTVDRVPKRGAGSVSKGGAEYIDYYSTLKGPDGAQLGLTAVHVTALDDRAAFVFAQLLSPDTNIDIAVALDKLERDIGAALSKG